MARTATRPPSRRVLEGVVHQVAEDGPHPFFVAADENVLGRRIRTRNSILRAAAASANWAAHSSNTSRKRHVDDLESFFAGFDAGDLQHVQNQLMQPLGLLLDAGDEGQIVLGVVDRAEAERFRVAP